MEILKKVWRFIEDWFGFFIQIYGGFLCYTHEPYSWGYLFILLGFLISTTTQNRRRQQEMNDALLKFLTALIEVLRRPR